MASIVLSFVGNQDPFSDNTRQEGSIVTLVRHLISHHCLLSRVILLHTTATQERAELTKEWLADEAQLSGELVEIIPVDEKLSDDPVNLLLAAQEARKVLEKTIISLNKGDRLEFNASSGTPVMKSAWSILQAAGYTPHSRVWQVRNPDRINPDQSRVFETNVAVLKNEFDLKVIQRQINDYNYSGALSSLENSLLDNETIKALLAYGNYRMAFDFDRAYNSIFPWKEQLDGQFFQQISALRQKQPEALLKEVYFKALCKLKNHEYSDFLIQVFSFQENVLKFLLKGKFCSRDSQKKPWKEIESDICQEIRVFDKGKLYNFLNNYRSDSKWQKWVNQDWLNRPVMLATIEYFPEFNPCVKPLYYLNDFCQQRNDSVHQLEGVSDLPNQGELLVNLRLILKAITSLSDTNPFDFLNHRICTLLVEANNQSSF